VKVLLLAFLFATGSVAAQEANTVFLDATYLGAPTDWCTAEAGVPLVVKMDGPDIVEGPKAWPRTVKVFRGGDLQIVHTGENTASFIRPEDFGDASAEVIGRFSAEFRACHSAWQYPRLTGSWRLTRADGETMNSGTFEDAPPGILHLPFFHPVGGPSKAHFAEFGDQRFFTVDQPATEITQTFAAKSDKE
jgi:hypothetical protein